MIFLQSEWIIILYCIIIVSSTSSQFLRRRHDRRQITTIRRRWTLQDCLEQLRIGKIIDESKVSFKQFEGLLKDPDQIDFYKRLESSKSKGNYTFFIPVDSSFSSTNLQNMSRTEKRRFIQFHMFPGHHTGRSIRDGGILTSLEGSKAFTNKRYDSVLKKIRFWIQGAEIITPNILIGHNLVHIIERRIEPPKLSLFNFLKQSGRHDIMLRQLEKYRVYFQFSFGVTFFAPYDSTYSNVPFKMKEQILKDDLSTRVSIK